MSIGYVNPLDFAESTSPSSVTTYTPGGSVVAASTPGMTDEDKKRLEPWRVAFSDLQGNLVPYDPSVDIYEFARQHIGPAHNGGLDNSLGRLNERTGASEMFPNMLQWNDASIGPTQGAYVRGGVAPGGMVTVGHSAFEQISPAELAMYVRDFLPGQISLEEFGANQDELIPLLVPGAQYDKFLGWYAPKGAAQPLYDANKQRWLAGSAALNRDQSSGWEGLIENFSKVAAPALIGWGVGGAIGGPAASGASATTTAAPTAVPAGGAAVGAGGTITTAASPVIQGAVQGAVNGALNGWMSGGNVLQSALQGATAGGAGASSVNVAGVDSRLVNAAMNSATQAATMAAMRGEDIWQAAAMGAVAGLTAAAGDAPAQPAGRGMLGERSPLADAFSPANPEIYQPLTTEEMLFGGAPQPGTYTPLPLLPQSPTDMLRAAPIGAATLTQEPESPAPAPSQTPSLEQAPEVEPEVTLDTAARYAGYAKKVYDAYSAVVGDAADTPAFEMPEQGEDQSDEEYLEEVGNYAVEYLSLDPEAMLEAGLTPGTQEYLDYILEQADAIIAAVFGDDPESVLEGASVEDLQSAVRDLAENESQQLLRALYTRGALGQMSSAGSVTDPFTDISEETGMLGGEVNAPAAGQQRGYARSIENLLGMPRGEAAESLRGMLGRDIDLFGLQGSADARALADQLTSMQDEETKRRRGMVGGDAGYWNDILSKMDPRQLQQLLAQFGGSKRQGAAVETLMGRKR